MRDIIALSNNLIYKDLFISLTCNPRCTEIERASISGQYSADRPDLCNCGFRMNWKLLMRYLMGEKPFGLVTADISVIESQKRGLMHAHII